jgi:hypothetical protein
MIHDMYEMQVLKEQTETLETLTKEKKDRLNVCHSYIGKRRRIEEWELEKAVKALDETVKRNHHHLDNFIQQRKTAAKTRFPKCEESALYGEGEIPEKPTHASAIAKLTTLFDDEEIGRGVIDMIFYHGGIVAGGAAVYALCKFVKRSSVSDIDVFIASAVQFAELLREFNQLCVEPIMTTINQYMCEVDLDVMSTAIKSKNLCSVVMIDIGQRIKIQLILKENATAIDILGMFDLDYVCCAIDNYQLTITEDCKAAHEARKVMKGYYAPCRQRLIKARGKGFTVPIIFGKEQEKVAWFPVESEDRKVAITSFERTQPRFDFDMKDVVCNTSTATVNGVTFEAIEPPTVFYSPWQTVEPITFPTIQMNENTRSIHLKCRDYDFYCEERLEYYVKSSKKGGFEVYPTGEIK